MKACWGRREASVTASKAGGGQAHPGSQRLERRTWNWDNTAKMWGGGMEHVEHDSRVEAGRFRVPCALSLLMRGNSPGPFLPGGQAILVAVPQDDLQGLRMETREVTHASAGDQSPHQCSRATVNSLREPIGDRVSGLGGQAPGATPLNHIGTRVA